MEEGSCSMIKRLFIIEGIPKRNKCQEGLVLLEFLKMTIPGQVRFQEFRSSVELQNFLNNEENNRYFQKLTLCKSLIDFLYKIKCKTKIKIT